MKLHRRNPTQHCMTIRGLYSQYVPGFIQQLEDKRNITVLEALYTYDEQMGHPILEIVYIERARWTRIKIQSRRFIPAFYVNNRNSRAPLMNSASVR